MLASLGLSPSAICFIILALAVALFVWNRLPIGIVAIATALALWATGLLTLNQALAGFGDPVVIFIASLFVVSEALDATGVTTWAGLQLIARVGDSHTRLVVLSMLLAAGLTALISPNGAVAALVPMVVILAVRLGRSPSLLLMPVAFGAYAGSLLLLTGGAINVIVSEAALDAGLGGFGFFEYALVGVPLVVGTIAIVVLLGQRLLPERTAKSIPPNLSGYARTMRKHYRLPEGLVRLRVEHGSPLVGTPRSALQLSAYPGTQLVGVYASGGGPPADDVFRADDVLVLRGNASVVRQMADSCTARHGAAACHWPGSGPVAALLAACALILLGVLSVNQAYRAISWTTIVLIGGIIPLSHALQSTGAAEVIAQALVRLVGDTGPYTLLIGLVLITAVLGQMISNTATVLVVVPIALSAAEAFGVSGRPMLMAVNVMSAAAFLTPIATLGNMMVMGPGGYRFGDYARLGLPMLVWFAVVAVGLVPLIWRF